MQRPLGVTILAVLAAIGGVLGILAGVALMGLSSASSGLAISGLSGYLGLFGGIVLITSVLELVLAYGFWTLKPWAWLLGIVLEIVGVGTSLLTFRSETATSTITSVVIAGIIIYYLWQPHVRRAFGQRA